MSEDFLKRIKKRQNKEFNTYEKWFEQILQHTKGMKYYWLQKKALEDFAKECKLFDEDHSWRWINLYYEKASCFRKYETSLLKKLKIGNI